LLARPTSSSKIACLVLAGVLADPAKVSADPPVSEKTAPNYPTLTTEDPFSQLTTPPVGVPSTSSLGALDTNAGSPGAKANITTNKSAVITASAATTTEQDTTKPNYSAIFSSLAAIASYGLFYRQLKRGETPGNLPTAIMYTVNDCSLLLAAVLTPAQGMSARIVYGVFAGFGVLITRHLVATTRNEQKEGAELTSGSLWSKFSDTEKRCTIAASIGIAAMLSSNLPIVTAAVPQSFLVMFGASMGVAVNALSSIPLIQTMLRREPQEARERSIGKTTSTPLWERLSRTIKPVFPYALGTATLIVSAMSVEKFSVETLLSPIGMTITNVALTTSIAVWSWRQSGKSVT